MKKADDDNMDATNRKRTKGWGELGNPARDGEAQKSNGAQDSKSGEVSSYPIALGS